MARSNPRAAARRPAVLARRGARGASGALSACVCAAQAVLSSSQEVKRCRNPGPGHARCARSGSEGGRALSRRPARPTRVCRPPAYACIENLNARASSTDGLEEGHTKVEALPVGERLPCEGEWVGEGGRRRRAQVPRRAADSAPAQPRASRRRCARPRAPEWSAQVLARAPVEAPPCSTCSWLSPSCLCRKPRCGEATRRDEVGRPPARGRPGPQSTPPARNQQPGSWQPPCQTTSSAGARHAPAESQLAGQGLGREPATGGALRGARGGRGRGRRFEGGPGAGARPTGARRGPSAPPPRKDRAACDQQSAQRWRRRAAPWCCWPSRRSRA
jgi:hypothetical protein